MTTQIKMLNEFEKSLKNSLKQKEYDTLGHLQEDYDNEEIDPYYNEDEEDVNVANEVMRDFINQEIASLNS